jgi:hypothetical protein
MRSARFGGWHARWALIGSACALGACGGSDGTRKEAGCTPSVYADAGDGGWTGDAVYEDASPGDDASTDGPASDAAPGCSAVVFGDDFEAYAAGDPLAAIWQLVVDGPTSTARINLDAEGHGNGGSNRYVLFSNNGSEPNSVQISAATPPLNVSGCSAATLTASVVVFSLEENENDHAFVEVRANGNDWTPMYMPFPSPDFPENINCRAGGQETGCVAFKTVQVTIPRIMMGPDLQVRFRLNTLTAVSDFFGFDDVTVAGIP